ncbi:unnamed protein product [Symbiodinium microadriaticum]|nr:unnamed protein product [Symbiodinium sp. KB8]CAE7863428.1 unnamed protein product [Symbiodinium microadriaticum]
MEVLKDSDPDYEGKQGTNKDQTARVLIREVLIPRTAAERKFAEEFHSPILNWDSPTLAQKTQYGHLAESAFQVCTSANRALCLSLLSSKRVAAFFEPAGRRTGRPRGSGGAFKGAGEVLGESAALLVRV